MWSWLPDYCRILRFHFPVFSLILVPTEIVCRTLEIIFYHISKNFEVCQNYSAVYLFSVFGNVAKARSFVRVVVWFNVVFSPVHPLVHHSTNTGIGHWLSRVTSPECHANLSRSSRTPEWDLLSADQTDIETRSQGTWGPRGRFFFSSWLLPPCFLVIHIAILFPWSKRRETETSLCEEIYWRSLIFHEHKL